MADLVYEEIQLDGKVIGKLINDTYYTYRDSKTHYYVKGKGYPISTAILKQLEARGCRWVFIKEVRANGTIKRYKCLLEQYLKAEVFKEEGYDLQQCHPLKEMDVIPDY